MHAMLLRFWADESAEEIGGFALFIALIVIVLIAAYGPFRHALAARFGSASGVLRIPTN